MASSTHPALLLLQAPMQPRYSIFTPGRLDFVTTILVICYVNVECMYPQLNKAVFNLSASKFLYSLVFIESLASWKCKQQM